jgi:hypothetical protein
MVSAKPNCNEKILVFENDNLIEIWNDFEGPPCNLNFNQLCMTKYLGVAGNISIVIYVREYTIIPKW